MRLYFLSILFFLAFFIANGQQEAYRQNSFSIADSKKKGLFIKEYHVAQKPGNILNVIECWEDSVFYNNDSHRKSFTPTPYYSVFFRIDERNIGYNSATFYKTWGLEALGNGYGGGISCYFIAAAKAVNPAKTCIYQVYGSRYPPPDSFAIRIVRLPNGITTPEKEKIKIGNLYFKGK